MPPLPQRNSSRRRHSSSPLADDAGTSLQQQRGLPRMKPVRETASAHAASEASTSYTPVQPSGSSQGRCTTRLRHPVSESTSDERPQGTQPEAGGGFTSARYGSSIRLMSADTSGSYHHIAAGDLASALSEHRPGAGSRPGNSMQRSAASAAVMQPRVGEEEEFSEESSEGESC